MTSGLVTATMTETVGGEFIDLTDPELEKIHLHDIAWAISRQSRYAGHTMSKIPYTVAQHTVMVSRYVEEALTPDTELYGQFRRYLEEQFKLALNGRKASEKTNESCDKWSRALDKHIQFSSEGMDTHRRMYTRHGLMHDYAEYILVDLPTPVKRLPGVYEAYKKYELIWDAAMYKKFQLGYGPEGLMSGPIKHPEMWEFGLIVVAWADMYALLLEAYHFMPSRAKNWNISIEGPSLSKIYNFRWPVSNEQAYLELVARHEELDNPELIYE